MSEEVVAKIRSFKDLKVWQKGVDLVELIYKVTKKFPKEEMYGLSAQLRRAAVSVPSNIAEGFGRYHNKEYKQFLHVALGSCAEIVTQMIIAERLRFVEKSVSEQILSQADEISRMLMSLIKKVRARQ